MNLFRKVITGVTVGILSLVVAGGIGNITVDASEITMDYDNQVMNIRPDYGDSKKVLVSYPKVTKKYGKYTVKQTAWDVYEVGSDGSVAVDLSHLNPTKDNYIAVRDTYPRADDGLDTTLVELPANDILKKGTYDAQTHSMTIYGADGRTEYEGTCLYRTAVSSWKEYTPGVDLSVYEYQGTVLYVKPSNNPAPVHEYTPQGITEGYRLMMAGSFTGKELKVKVTKLANAPSITADYTKRTFTVKKGYQYRFNGGKWSDVVTEKSVTLKLDDYAEKDTSGFGIAFYDCEFEVRKAATVSASGKYTPPSKIGGMACRAVMNVQAQLGADDQYGTVSCTVTSEGVGNNVVISNTGDDAYDVYVSDKALTATELAAVTTGIKKLAGCTNWGQTKKLTLKNANGKYVYIRYAGNKSTGMWASDFELLVRPSAGN